MIDEDYVWFVWSSLFLLPWLIIYVAFAEYRTQMLKTSLATAPFGLTEPLFVPEYWNPPSLFDLAQTTGFDIESLIFCFGIGGTGAVAYNVFSRRKIQNVPCEDRHSTRHRFHWLALTSPIIIFVALVFFEWNAIYPGIIAMFGGALATMYCRPDLLNKTWMGGLIFLVYYMVLLFGLEWLAPGYIDRVWNIENLTGVRILGFPLEEYLFAFGFGLYWSSVYEHVTWRKPLTLYATQKEGK